MENIEERLVQLEAKIDGLQKTTEKVRKYLLFIIISTIVMFLLPLIMAGVMLPFLMSTIGGIYSI